MKARVLVSIVTYNSAPHLVPCLESLKAQTFQDFTIHAWDNASSDDSPRILATCGDFIHTTHLSPKNIGFCAANNHIIDSADSDYVLALNPDVILDAKFLDCMISALEEDKQAGSATGKLWRHPSGGNTFRIIDTTGIYFTPNQRHLDRGAGEMDSGQYDRREYVFGASGAAAVYRRAMLEDTKAGNEYFDEAFFAYREDADLAWRAQWMGWRCLYVPEAVGFHVRKVLPERRAALSNEINMHSFKNRFLLRIKNMDVGTYVRYFIPITIRDLGALGYVLVCEQSSLRAVPTIFHALPNALKVRKTLHNRRRATPQAVRSWFSNRPTSRPVQPLGF
jgi:GT2 family glycosyltransferase